MGFTDKEVQEMQSIFRHLEPKTLESIQAFRPDVKFRLAVTIGIKNRRNQYVYIYQYFKNLSPARLRILNKRKKDIPYELYQVQFEQGYICLGWKIIK